MFKKYMVRSGGLKPASTGAEVRCRNQWAAHDIANSELKKLLIFFYLLDND